MSKRTLQLRVSRQSDWTSYKHLWESYCVIYLCDTHWISRMHNV